MRSNWSLSLFAALCCAMWWLLVPWWTGRGMWGKVPLPGLGASAVQLGAPSLT